MANNFFKSPTQVLQDMLADYKAITGIDLSPSDLGREEVVKFFPIAGAISAFYAMIVRTYDDFFPASASGVEALNKHLQQRQLPTQIQAQPSTGLLHFTGVTGAKILAGAQARRKLDGSIYVARQDITLDNNGDGIGYFISLLSGSSQNVETVGEVFTLVNAPTGVNPGGVNDTQFLDGRDVETAAEMLARIEEHDRNDNTGGNLAAYEAFARQASPQVVNAKAIKNPRGAGTVNTVITAGTTDIEAAVNNGQSVLRIPDSSLIATVQAYILDKNPTTDDHQTVAPVEVSFNVTVTYGLYDESLRSSINAIIQRVVKIFIYSALPTDVLWPTDLERAIDKAVGGYIKSRRVSDFSGSVYYTVPADSILKPGTITIQGLV